MIHVNFKKRLSANEALQHPWLQKTMDESERIDINRPDLADVIFTEKEKQTIKKDYLSRLEKIKQRRFPKPVKPNQSDANDFYRNIPTEDDQILLFTEHNLDTKEDEKHDKAPMKGSDDEYDHLFDKKRDNF